MRFINQYKERFGVEPICQTLEVAPSTYYAAVARPPSARRLRDEELKVEISRVHKDNLDVYGVEKVWKQLRREGIEVGRDRIARPADLVERDFTAAAPNRLWVVDLTYVSTWAGV